MSENYYSILNIDKKSKKEDIESAYRKLAIKWHPDKNKNNKDKAEIKFRDISKAYGTLSDDKLRKHYDEYGIDDSNKNIENLIDPHTMFKDIFNTEDNSIPKIIIRLDATIEQLYTGFTENVKYTRYSPCVKCECTGTHSKECGSCENCKGRGIVLETLKGGKMGYMINEKKCEICEGNGLNPDIKKCKKCDGNKYIKEDIECEVDVPPGAYDDYFIRLENEGNYIPEEDRLKSDNSEIINDKTRTDVEVVIKEISDKNSELNIKRGILIKEIGRFNRADLLININISFEESIIGIKKELKFLSNTSIGIEIDNVIQSGDVYVIENMGMPVVPEEIERVGTIAGDLFISFKVDKPVLDNRQRKRLWQVITNTSYPVYNDINDVHKTINLEHYIKTYIGYTKKENKKSFDNMVDDS
jgi:molecular chaperone DnaJ